VHHAFFVGGSQPESDLNRNFSRSSRRHCRAMQPIAKGFSFEQFADHVRNLIEGTYVMHSQNIGMVESSDGPGFLFEAPQPIGVGCERGRKHLDRHIAPEPRVPRAIHLAHTARTQRRLNFIRTKFSASGERHACALL
jgi:hypothetical protein